MTITIRSLLLLGTIISSAFAAPVPEDNSKDGGNKTPQPPPLPSSSLPPPTGLTLKHITLGVGTQNYTCNSTTGTFGSNVAVAKLYDATRYLSKHPNKVSTLSHDRLREEGEKGECANEKDFNPHLKLAGHHYFANAIPLLPDFDLSKFNLFLEARGVQRVPAPDSANDIDWIYLADSSSGQSRGLKAVYRVETAGGRPPATCSGTEQAIIPYVAQYWFYD